MSDTPNTFMMIGLHKLAAERGDGLIPELLALYKENRSQMTDVSDRHAFELPEGTNSNAAPISKVREASTMAAGNDNVIQFRPYLLAKRSR